MLEQHDRPSGVTATSWPGQLAPLLLFLAACALILLRQQFDGLYGQDAYAYYAYALRLRQALLQLEQPPPFYWPAGYPALVALSVCLIGATPLAGQLVSLIAGAGVVVLTSALAYELLRQQGLSEQPARRVAFVAGLVAASCGQLLQWSISVMSDSAALFWASLGAWALVRYGPTCRQRWLLLTACALAWAVITRWVYGLLMVPFAAYLLLQLPTRRPTRASRVSAGAVYRQLALAGLMMLALLLPQLVLSARFPESVVRHQWLVSWSPLNAVRREFATVDGYASYPLPVALFYAKTAVSPRYLFPLLTPLLLLGVVTALRRHWWSLLVLLAGWGGLIYSFLVGIPYQNFRFTLALLPPVAIFTALGLHQTDSWLAPRWRPLLLAYTLAALLGGLWYSNGVLEEFVGRKQADLEVVRWAQQQVPPGGRVLTFGLTLALQHYTTLDVHELFLLTPETLAALLDDDQPVHLLVDVEGLQRQWPGHPPERNYRLLWQEPGLTSLGSRHGYTLFRVGPAMPGTP